MAITWNSLHLYSEATEQVHAQLRQILTDSGYTLYDPFGIMPGRAYPVSVRLFISPPANGWTRIIGTRTPAETLEALLLPSLSRLGTTLAVTLDGQDAHMTVYQDGHQAAPLDALTPYLRSACTARTLEQALQPDSGTRVSQPEGQTAGDVPVGVLPKDVQDMAARLKSGQINRLFNRVLKAIGGRDDQRDSEARKLLENSQPDWQSSGGCAIQAVMRCLIVPDDWAQPDFVTLRDAYQLHIRQQRKPDAPLYPGDAEALQAVPDALDYISIYGGQAGTP